MTDVPATAAQAELADLTDGPDERRVRREAAIVADLVDRAYYALTNAELLEYGEDPVEHFCRVGWRMLRKPNPDFDVWWYWVNHLDPAVDDINPLVHYALVGRELGLSTRPEPPTATSEGAHLPRDRPVRRACLFAGFDTDSVVDESVVLLIQELSRHADVFYLCDGYLPPDELAKLDGLVEAAWAVRQGAYDFGSYSLLARELVGWDRLAGYDEVLLVNDSCFLVRPLDEVFATMDARACDWWGLQATKGLASTRDNPRNGFDSPIPIDEVRTRLLADYEDDPVYDFHLGSYFLAFRRPVLDDPVFRRLLDSVGKQPGKLVVILKYEIGLTHLLIGRGHVFQTYVSMLHPFHPLFTETHFRLIDEGFPLLKRFLISQNHYDIPEVAQWRERVLAAAPGAPVDVFERTLARTAPDDRLRRNLAITRTPDGRVKVPRVVRGRAYARRDIKVEKRPDVWAFAVDPKHHLLPDNSRAILEAVKDDPSITKVILTRSRRFDVPGANVVMEPLLSPIGRDQLMRSGVVFVSSQPVRTLRAPVSSERQVVIATRAGLLLERQGRTRRQPEMPEHIADEVGPLAMVHPDPDITITSLPVASDVDRLAAVATYWPTTFAQTWTTGLPAHDFLFAAEETLPGDLRDQLGLLRAELAGRRLLLLAPTQRRSGSEDEPYVFSQSERDHLRAWATANDAVIGIREPGRDFERSYAAQLGGLTLDLSARRYPLLPAVLRAASAVLTDYSGAALDFAAAGGTVVSFMHDLEAAQDRTLFDMEHFFPGPVARDFDQLAAALDAVFDQPAEPRYARIRDLLVDHHDDGSTARLLDRIHALKDAR